MFKQFFAHSRSCFCMANQSLEKMSYLSITLQNELFKNTVYLNRDVLKIVLLHVGCRPMKQGEGKD